MTKDEIVKYVMNTPGNTNEQVLRLALDDLEGVNPNSTKVITGTVGSPFGEITKEQFEEYAQKLADKDMSILIQSDLGFCYVFGVPAQTDPPETAVITGNGAAYNDVTSRWSAFDLDYRYSTELSVSGPVMIGGSQLADLSLIKATVCTTTFIYHPLSTA